jgi:hypothetical protein
MSILAIRRGLSNKNKIVLQFDISEEQLQGLAVWNNRRNANKCVTCFVIHCESHNTKFQRIRRKHMLFTGLLYMEKRRAQHH